MGDDIKAIQKSVISIGHICVKETSSTQLDIALNLIFSLCRSKVIQIFPLPHLFDFPSFVSILYFSLLSLFPYVVEKLDIGYFDASILIEDNSIILQHLETITYT